jgi:hypothetical protein
MYDILLLLYIFMLFEQIYDSRTTRVKSYDVKEDLFCYVIFLIRLMSNVRKTRKKSNLRVYSI